MRTKKVIQKMAILEIVIVFLLSSWSPAGAQEKSDEVNNEPIPFGINNPFKHPDSDKGSWENCLKPNSSLEVKGSYVERHIEPDGLKRCLRNGTKYMENIKDIGVNVISQHFPRRYCEDDCVKKEDKELPYFGLEEGKHRNHEIAVQLYINGFDNYFWAVVEPSSGKSFPGDVQIIEPDGPHKTYLPNSDEGFAEYQNWLAAMFDYLDAHRATDKLLYIQLGNESDGDYRKKTGANPQNRDDYHWLAYAKLIENSYKIIRERAPKAKIAIGTIGAGGITIDGFQRPVLEYLSGKIDEEGKIVHREKRCGGSGCFDVYDYHDFSGYQDYQEWKACRPRNCEGEDHKEILKSPKYFRDLLNDTGFSDKKLVVQQGGTYTGQDNKINKDYQTEKDQAAYLVKRGVYLLSEGLEAMQSVTYIEHSGYHGTIHNWFTLMGLTYNGTPTPGKIPSYLSEPSQEMKNKYGNVCNKYPDRYKPWCKYRNNQATCDGQFPCPDPGKDVKKASWFSYKKLIATLKNSDYQHIEKVDTDASDTLAYKFIKNDTQEPVYVAWWDWWKDYPRKESEVKECTKTYKGDYILMDECVNNLDQDRMSQDITLNFDFAEGRIRVTEAIPDYTSGKQAETADYENAFSTYTKEVNAGKVELTLGKKPVYIEKISDREALNFTMTVKWGNVLGQVIDKSQTNFDGSIRIPEVDPSSTVHHPQVKLKLIEAKSFEGSHGDRITFRTNPVSWKSQAHGGWDGVKVAILAWPNEKVVIQTTQGAITTTVQELYDLKTPFIQDVGKGREIVLSDTPKIEEDLPFGSITASPNPCIMSPEQDVCSSTISWQTQNAPNACILMKESGKTFACGASGNQSAPWINEDGATFELHASNDLSSPVLASILVKGKKQPRINITSPQPTGGDVWAWAETHPLSWVASNLATGGTISIEIYAGPRLKQTLFTNIPNTNNSQDWTIPKITPGDNYRVRIISLRNDGTIEMSAYSQFFRIKPSIIVTSPDGGEKWEAGKPQTITWSFNAPTNTFVSLKLTRAGLSPISLVSGLQTSKGAYSFIMARGITGESFKVQAELYLINTPTQHSLITSDESDGLFSIVPPVPPAITVISPNGGEKWEAGKPQTITWSAKAPTNTFVSLKLTRAGLSPISLVSGLQTSKGAYSFIMARGITGESFKVQAELYLINTPTQHSLIASDESDGLLSFN